MGGAGRVLSMLVAPARRFVYLLIAAMTLNLIVFSFSFNLYFELNAITRKGIEFAMHNVFGGVDRLSHDFLAAWLKLV